MIENTAHEIRAYKHKKVYKQGTIKESSKWERGIRSGACKAKEKSGFPNYFIAQKARAKVTQADETRGN